MRRLRQWPAGLAKEEADDDEELINATESFTARRERFTGLKQLLTGPHLGTS
jgi:hypothetical protein